MKRLSFFICAVIFLTSASLSKSDTDIPQSDIQISLALIEDGLTLPIALAAPRDGRLFIAQQTGEIWVIRNGERLREPLLNLRDRMMNVQHRYDERGLLGMALHPEFATNGKFYVYYSAPLVPISNPDGDHTARISEFTISPDNPNRADPNTERYIFQTDEPFGNHNGGQLAFGWDGYLYIGLGDGGDHGDPFDLAQNLDSYMGKILRIDVNSGDLYGIPPDNPFINGGGLPEIYAYGLRNPFRFSFDAPSRLMIAGDVGQNQWEEINLIYKGVNYGWSVREGYACFNEQDFEKPLPRCNLGSGSRRIIDPVMAYDHSVGISVIGGYVYRGYRMPDLYGWYIFAEWSSYNTIITSTSGIFAAPIEGENRWQMEELQLVDENGAPLLRNFLIHSWGQDAKGELYLLTQAGTGDMFKDGALYKVVPPKSVS